MALSITTIWEIRTGGSDTANSGAFDPGQTAGMNTNGAATNANTSAPVFTSATYNFVAGDVGAYIYIASGTNWFAGWYKIASVAANAATLTATIGSVVGTVITGYPINTIVGCASVASPTTATWAIDYSQQNATQYTYTDLASTGAGLTVSSVLLPFNKEQVGNSILVTGGTNFTPGLYVIASVTTGVATVVGAANITTGIGAAGTGSQGGACASPGQAAKAAVATNDFFIQSGTYSITSASTNISGGCISVSGSGATTNGMKWTGYQNVRGDNGTMPLLQASGISTFTIFVVTGNYVKVQNISFDGASLTSSRGASGNVVSLYYRCKFSNFTNGAINSNGVPNAVFCEGTGCSTVTVFFGCQAHGTVAHDNTIGGFGNNNGSTHYSYCISCNNSGAASDGFSGNPNGSTNVINCLAFNNGRHGFDFTAVSTMQLNLENCLAVNNTGFGFTATAGSDPTNLVNCAGYNNTSGLVSAFIYLGNISGLVTLTGDPFNNAAGNDFSLNNTIGAGASCRAGGAPTSFPGTSTNHFIDIGVAQHQDSGGGITFIYNVME